MSNDEQTAAGAAAAEPAPVADVEAIAQDPTDAEPAMAEAVRAGRAVAALADAVLAEDSQTAAEKAAAPEAPAPAEAQPAPEPALPVRESPAANRLPISVGRIVLVQVGGEVMPGIVSRVHNRNVLGVHVCVPRAHHPVVYYDPVRYDAAGGGMTWHWPPRV